jgi:hypothetical protein
VGHHGSLNATPKTLLWAGFRKRNKKGPERLQTLLSTLPGKHGKKRHSLWNTDELKMGQAPHCHAVEVRIS